MTEIEQQLLHLLSQAVTAVERDHGKKVTALCACEWDEETQSVLLSPANSVRDVLPVRKREASLFESHR